MGRAMSDVLSKQDKQVVMEGQEPAEFWVALGGKAPYASDKRQGSKFTPLNQAFWERNSTVVEFLAQTLLFSTYFLFILYHST